jgi:hypothetical protein
MEFAVTQSLTMPIDHLIVWLECKFSTEHLEKVDKLVSKYRQTVALDD